MPSACLRQLWSLVSPFSGESVRRLPGEGVQEAVDREDRNHLAEVLNEFRTFPEVPPGVGGVCQLSREQGSLSVGI